MEIKEYQKDGMNVREIWIDGVLKGKEECPILIISSDTQPTLEDKINYLYYKDMGVI